MSTESYIQTDIDPSSSILESIETYKKTETLSSAEYSYKFESVQSKEASGERRTEPDLSLPTESISLNLAHKLHRLLRKNAQIRETTASGPIQRKAIYQKQIKQLKTEKSPCSSTDFPIEIPTSVLETLKSRQLLHTIRAEIAQIDQEFLLQDAEKPTFPIYSSEDSEAAAVEIALMKALHASNRHYR